MRSRTISATGRTGRLRQPKLVIRAGFGIFYDRFAINQVLTAEQYNGVTQQRFIVQNPQFYLGNIPPLSSLVSQPAATYQIDPGLVSPRILQSAIGFDRQLPKNITLSMNYTNSVGEHQLLTRNINAPVPGTFPANPVYPMGNNDPVYQYESVGIFRQNQLITNVNARLNAKYTLFGFYAYSHANSNTDGAGTFPANSYDLAAEYSRAQYDIRHRFLIGGSLAAPYGIVFNPFVTYASAAPFNIVLGQDLNGDTVSTDRPSFATPNDDPRYVVQTPYGPLNMRPLPGETIIPRNLGQGFGSFTINLRVSRTWGFGERTTRAAGAGGGGPGGPPPGGAVFRGGPGGGRGPGGGGPGGPVFLGGNNSGRRYSLTLSLQARNLLNTVNPGQPVGILGSPQFGEAQGLAGGGFGPGGGGPGGAGGFVVPQSANRRLEMQIRFSF
jgi:hypothetical protein